jgi:hypothetical protein
MSQPTPLPWWKTPWVLWNAAAVLAVVVLLGGLWLWQPSDLRFVREARLAGYPPEPLGAVLDQFITDPQWQSGRDADGQHWVTVRGRVNYLGATTAVVHFRVDPEHRSLALAGLELDGRPKNNLVQSAFLRRAYADYQKVLLQR